MPRAAKAFSRPPLATLPASSAVGVTPLRIAPRISATEMPGLAAASRATTPVTCGAAIEVPESMP